MDVYQEHALRWAIERAQFANAHQMLRHKNAEFEPWHPEDFIETPKSRALREQREKDARDLAAELIADRNRTALMKAGKFDESLLPAWARMTEEERRARGR